MCKRKVIERLSNIRRKAFRVFGLFFLPKKNIQIEISKVEISNLFANPICKNCVKYSESELWPPITFAKRSVTGEPEIFYRRQNILLLFSDLNCNLGHLRMRIRIFHDQRGSWVSPFAIGIWFLTQLMIMGNLWPEHGQLGNRGYWTFISTFAVSVRTCFQTGNYSLTCHD